LSIKTTDLLPNFDNWRYIDMQYVALLKHGIKIGTLF
jgi:hypothetical protein